MNILEYVADFIDSHKDKLLLGLFGVALIIMFIVFMYNFDLERNEKDSLPDCNFLNISRYNLECDIVKQPWNFSTKNHTYICYYHSEITTPITEYCYENNLSFPDMKEVCKNFVDEICK